jgi:serine/threonine protein kinase
MNQDPPEPPPPSVADTVASRRGVRWAETPPANFDYALLRRVGHGGYGEVWLVRDRAGRLLACKVVYRDSFGNDRPYEREYAGIRKFEPVSRASESQINIFEVGRRDDAGYFYYIMELADDAGGGRDIDPDSYVPKTLKSELQRRKRFPADECLRLGFSLSAAVDNLHRNGLIHRDIKPANIIFANGVPKLADIGLVTEADLTISYVGTEGYIPPEGPTSPQADIYSLGKVLYELGTGKDCMSFPELPADFRALPDRERLLELNAVVTKACHRDVRARYASAQELNADLGLLLRGKSVRKARLRKRRLALAAKTAVVLALAGALAEGVVYFRHHLAGLAPSVSRTGRRPLPDAGLLAQREAAFMEKSRQRLAGGDDEARLSLAREWLDRSTNSDDPVAQLAGLRVAGALAMEAGDFATVSEACARIAERFTVDASQVKLDMLAKMAGRATTPQGSADLAEFCVAGGFEAMAADDYARATEWASRAASAVQTSMVPHVLREAAFLDSEAARCRREYEAVKPSVEVLRGHPDDPAASLQFGKFLCFAKNDWATGLPMMARGNDAALKPVLDGEHKAPAGSREQRAVGDLWWNLATPAAEPDRSRFAQRARYWYLKALANAAESEKSGLRQQWAERIAVTPPVGGELRIFSRVEGSEEIDISRDGVRWTSSRGSQGNRINDVQVGDLKRGGTRNLRNSGATRLFPEGVDFLTAQLTVAHKFKRRGKVLLEVVAEDHVRVRLEQSGGLSDLEVTVTFGNPP